MPVDFEEVHVSSNADEEDIRNAIMAIRRNRVALKGEAYWLQRESCAWGMGGSWGAAVGTGTQARWCWPCASCLPTTYPLWHSLCKAGSPRCSSVGPCWVGPS